MKKMMFYLVLLSLMAACKHSPPPPLEIVDPPSKVVNCDSTTRYPVLAQKWIVGKWIWVYSYHYNRRLGYREIWTPANYRNNVKDVMLFDENGGLSVFEDDKLVTKATYAFQKFSTISNIPADSTRFVLALKYSGRGVCFFEICPDSMYLPYQSFGYDISGDQVWAKY